jgi:hypothetical protein
LVNGPHGALNEDLFPARTQGAAAKLIWRLSTASSPVSSQFGSLGCVSAPAGAGGRTHWHAEARRNRPARATAQPIGLKSTPDRLLLRPCAAAPSRLRSFIGGAFALFIQRHTLHQICKTPVAHWRKCVPRKDLTR